MNPLVSIIMPAFRTATTIAESIESVLAQTYKNFELLIIDDCSTDETSYIVEQFLLKDDRIKLIKKDTNQGVAMARNTGLDQAQGDFVAFLDSDDLWLPKKLQLQIEAVQKYKDVEVVFGSYYRFNDKGLEHLVSAPSGYLEFNDLLKGNFIGNLTGLYNFSKFKHIRQKKVGAEDYLFWLEVFEKGSTKAIGIQEPIAYYRVASNSTSLSGNKFKSASWTWKIYYKHLHLGIFKSLYYFVNYIKNAIKKRI